MAQKHLALAFSIMLPSLCFLACDKDPTPASQPCTYNSDCTAPLLCLGGQCKPECIEDIDCTNGAACIEGVCKAGTGGSGGTGGMGASSSSSGMGGMSSSSTSSSSSGGPSCNNNIMDMGETDVDCGGPMCSPCADGKKCMMNQDCSGGTCTANLCVSIYSLSVTLMGGGKGTVTSMPAGINCSPQCTADYASGTQIKLSAMPAADSTFAGWSGGGCSGNATCTVTMDAAQSVAATFNLKPTGMQAWQRSYGDSFNYVELRELGFDTNGNVLLTGDFGGNVDFGGGPISSLNTDLMVFKLDSAGNHVWSRRIGQTGSEYGRAVFADPMLNVIVVGELSNGQTTDMGGGNSLTCTVGFAAKYGAATGAHVWSKCLGTGGGVDVQRVASDAMGNFVVVGSIYNTVDFGGGAIVADASGSMFLAKFSGTDGSHIWSKKVMPRTDSLGDIAIDAAGNIGLVGWFSGMINLGGASLPSNGQTDMWIARFNATGQHVWSKHYGDTGNDEAYGVAFDATGNLVVTGKYTGAVDFGNGPVTNGGGEDAFLLKLTGANGALLWADHFGLGSSELGKSVTVAPDGSVIMGGYFYSQTDFGTGTINSMGGNDIFIVKYDGQGTFLWGKPIQTGQYDDVLAIETDKDNNSAFVGKFGSNQSAVYKFLP